MSAADHQRYADDVGAYLLGALPELEAQVFERHLQGCAVCREELERLRPAAEILPRSVEQFEPPATLRQSLMDTVRDEAGAGAGVVEQRRARRRFSLPSLAGLRPQLAWAAAALALVGVAVGFGIDRVTRSGSSNRTVAAQIDRSAVPGAGARVEVRDGAATLRVSGMPVLHGGRHAVYEVWIDRGGAVRPAGALFDVSTDGRGAAAIPRRLRKGDRVLVTRERAGGVQRPTERPIISARA